MESLYIIKIGGNVIDDPQLLNKFLVDFSILRGNKILVHGGGKLATEMANTLGIKQTMIDGRRITDKETLDIAVMVYAGLINKTIVAKLQALQCQAVGFCGADGNLITSEKRRPAEVDFGFVGDIPPNGVDVKQFKRLLHQGIVPVLSPITHDGSGNLLNTNADSMATAIALSLKYFFNVSLVYCFERKGVLQDTNNDNSFIPQLNKHTYSELKAAGIISKGMIPKLDNAFKAWEDGVKRLVICHASDILGLETQIRGTQLSA
jgi:acetylglutamate kinase